MSRCVTRFRRPRFGVAAARSCWDVCLWRDPGPAKIVDRCGAGATASSWRPACARATAAPRCSTPWTCPVDAGEIVALTGENGAGQDTLMRICAGLIAADAGDGSVAERGSATARRRRACSSCSPPTSTWSCSAAASACRARGCAAPWSRLLAEFDFPVGRRLVTAGHVRRYAAEAQSGAGAARRPGLLLLDEPYQGFDRGTYVNFWDHCDAGAQRARRSSSSRTCSPSWRASIASSNCPRTPRPGGRIDDGPERVLIMAEMHGRDLLRRHVALALLVALPLVFYLSSAGNGPQAMASGGIGMAFAVAGRDAVLRAVLARRRPALVLGGYRPVELLLGRLLFLGPLGAGDRRRLRRPDGAASRIRPTPGSSGARRRDRRPAGRAASGWPSARSSRASWRAPSC